MAMVGKTTKAAVLGAMIAVAAASANAFPPYGFIVFPLEGPRAPAGEDVDAYAARILRWEAEHYRAQNRVTEELTICRLPGISTGGESEEMEVFKHLARTERGGEAVAAACREALAGDDPYLKVVAFDFLAETEEAAAYREALTGDYLDLEGGPVDFPAETGEAGAEADAYLADLYESCGEGAGDLFMFAFEVEKALYPRRDEGPVGEAEELYGRLERDLAGGDKATRLKAAKAIAHMPYERTRALAASGMQSPDADVRRWCVIRLAYPYDRPAEERYLYNALVAALRDEDPLVRCLAAQGCFNTRDARVAGPLLALLDDGEVLVRRAAAWSLSAILEYAPAAGKDVSKKLRKRLRVEDDGVTRCFLAAAYGAATAKKGYEKALTCDGCRAFFTGEWREKDLESYYGEYEDARAEGG